MLLTLRKAARVATIASGLLLNYSGFKPTLAQPLQPVVYEDASRATTGSGTTNHLYVGSSGAWKKVVRAYIGSGGSWKPILTFYVGSSGAWKRAT